jgi:RND superfamily putative drug exporter
VRVVQLATDRRGRWVVIALWLVAAVVGYAGHSRLGHVTQGGQAAYLPKHSESTRSVDAMGKDFKGSDDVPAYVVFERDGGLTAADRAAIGRIGAAIDARGLRGATPAVDPFLGSGTANPLGRVGLIARDGEAALLPIGFNQGVKGSLTPGVEQVRDVLRANRVPGLSAHVTGPAGTAVDFEHAADDAGSVLLFVTATLVLLLLLVVYRAPILAVLPLAVVAAAYLVAAGLTYLLIEADAIEVNAEGTMLLLVLVFGAGTDYSLLLVHRYREELAAGTDDVAALRAAVRAAAPSILAAGATVAAAMLVLLLAQLESTHWLGPVLALGIVVMLLAAFTLLPALLSVLGRRAFWPAPEVAAATRSGRWERVAALVSRRARLLVAVIIVGLAVCACGNLVSTGTVGFGQGVLRATDSSRGTDILSAHFPPGLNAPLTVLVDDAAAVRALGLLEKLPGIDRALPAGVSQGSGLALLAVILGENPYGSHAEKVVRDMRKVLRRIDPHAAVSGIPAVNLDIEHTNAHDTRVVVPVVLLLVFLVLCGLLRAVAAPLYLVASVVASFAATLGISTVLFTQILGEDGLAFDLVLMAFIFLVALGVDYTIFLMHRTREETVRSGTRAGVLEALVTTGGVITGAGVILAGAFASLTILPLEELVQIGGTVAIGILLDTLVVRALLVTSITVLLGERTWWPGRVARTAAPSGGSAPR